MAATYPRRLSRNARTLRTARASSSAGIASAKRITSIRRSAGRARIVSPTERARSIRARRRFPAMWR